jgi:hypothetical protein
MQQRRRRGRYFWLALVALAAVGCAEPTPVATTLAAPDLSGVSFEVHQEPG